MVDQPQRPETALTPRDEKLIRMAFPADGWPVPLLLAEIDRLREALAAERTETGLREALEDISGENHGGPTDEESVAYGLADVDGDWFGWAKHLAIEALSVDRARRALAADSRPEQQRPSPHELWQQADGDRDRYLELMREHGHLIPGKREPGKDIFGHAVRPEEPPE